MNKSGKGGGKAVMVVGVIALVIIAVALLAQSGLLGNLGFQQSGIGSPVAVQQQVASQGCNVNPSLSFLGTDALVASQNITPTTYYYRVNGKYIGTSYSSPAQGDNTEAIGDLAGYLAGKVTQTITCGPNNVPIQLKAYTNATVSIKQDSNTGSSILSNAAAGGAVNETGIDAGSTKNFPVILTSVGQKSTGKMFFYVEMPSNSAQNVSSVTMSCNGANLPAVSIPSAVSSTNTNAFRTAFEIPALDNGAQTTCNLQVTDLGAKELLGAVRTTIYAEQLFADTDGSFKEGIYDANSAAKYQDSYTYNFLLIG